MSTVWLMIMDVAVMGLLGATLFFAIRLSRQLNEFRAGRRDLDRLVQNLATNVTQAERAIQGMKENARVCGAELQDYINSARSLSNELQFVSEAGESLASRLEGGRARKMPPRASAPPAMPAEKSPLFSIRDAEFEMKERGGNAGSLADNGLFPDEPDEEDHLHSQAERDLYRALRATQRKSGAAGIS